MGREAGAAREQFAVFVDGGIRRGADIFKAVALGAAAVGVGRPVLYSLASYGDRGIVRMVQMLQDELQMVMRLSGTQNITSITRDHVITKSRRPHCSIANRCLVHRNIPTAATCSPIVDTC